MTREARWGEVLTLGLGFLAALFNRERRGLADLIAGTGVVRVGP